MENKRIRRAMRKFVIHYGQQNTRKMTSLFASAYKTSKHRIAGNLRAMEYDEHTIQIKTHIPNSYSTMN